MPARSHAGAVADMMCAISGRARTNPTGLRRAFIALARRGFWIEQKVTLPGVHVPAADDDEADGDARQATTLVLVRLGDLGRDLLRVNPPCPPARLGHGSAPGRRSRRPTRR